MPFYRSGRSRVLTVSVDWSSPVRAEYVCTNTWPATPNKYRAERFRVVNELVISALKVVADYRPLEGFDDWPAPANCAVVLPGIEYPVRQTLTVFAGTTFEQTLMGEAAATYSVGAGTVADIVPDGTLTITAEVEEWFEVVDPILETDSNGFPNYGGSAAQHGITGRSVRFFEKLVVDSEFVVNWSGMAPLFWSGTVSVAMRDAFGELDYEVYRTAEVLAKDMSSILTSEVDFGGLECVAPYIVAGSGGLFDLRNGFRLELDRSGLDFATARGTASVHPATEFDLQAALFTGRESYSGSVDLLVQAEAGEGDAITSLNPAGSLAWDQVAWSGSAVLAGQVFAHTGVDTRRLVRAWLDGNSLNAQGDDARDWRMQFRGRKWTIGQLSHASETVLADGTLSGWTGDSGVGLSSSGGVLYVEGGLLGGSANVSFHDAIISETYRFLALRVRALGGSSVVRLGVDDGLDSEKKWEIVLSGGGTWQDVVLDLCRPEGGVFGSFDLVDEKDSRYPRRADGLVEDSWNWGVSRVEGLRIEEIEPGAEIELDFVKFQSLDPAKGTWSSGFLSWIQESIGSSLEVNRGWWSEVDGRICDVWDLSRSFGNLVWRSIGDWASAVEALGGWSFDPDSSLDNGYHGIGLPMETIFGGGAIYDPGLGWKVGWDAEFADVPSPLEAQALWDEVGVYPGAGQVFEPDGAYLEPTKLRMAKLVRAQAWGLAKEPSSVVLMREYLGGGVAGNAIADLRTEFCTKLPGARGNREHLLESGGVSSAEFWTTNRMRYRRVFREILKAGQLSLDWHLSGMHVRAIVSEGGMVSVGVKGNKRGESFLDIPTGLVGETVCVRWDRGRERRIWMILSYESEVTEYFSDDLGGSWQLSRVLSNDGKWPSLTVHWDGRRFAFWVSGTQVNGLIRDQSGSDLAEVTMARSGVDDGGLAVAGFELSGGEFRLEMLTVESGDLVLSTSSDGMNFS